MANDLKGGTLDNKLFHTAINPELPEKANQYQENPGGYAGPLIELLGDSAKGDQYIKDLHNAIREEFGPRNIKEAQEDSGENSLQSEEEGDRGKEGEQTPKPREQLDAFGKGTSETLAPEEHSLL